MVESEALACEWLDVIGRSKKMRFKTGLESSKTVKWADMQRKRVPIIRHYYYCAMSQCVWLVITVSSASRQIGIEAESDATVQGLRRFRGGIWRPSSRLVADGPPPRLDERPGLRLLLPEADLPDTGRNARKTVLLLMTERRDHFDRSIFELTILSTIRILTTFRSFVFVK